MRRWADPTSVCRTSPTRRALSDKGESRAHRGLDSGARRGGADGHPASRLRRRPRAPGPGRQRRLGLVREPAPPAARRPPTTRSTSCGHAPSWSPPSTTASTRRPRRRRRTRPRSSTSSGTIDANVDDANQPLALRRTTTATASRIEAFLAAYDPAVVGHASTPAGRLESGARRLRSGAAGARPDPRRLQHHDRRARRRRDAARRLARHPRHSTAVATATNIIIRNLTFQDTYDCFPQWSPTDGALGNWNALYDSISLRDGDHVWIDHNTFEDVDHGRRDAARSTSAALFQVHDGAARHHQRLRPRDRLLEPLPEPRQGHADRLVRQRAGRRRQAARDAAPQPVRRHRPARAARPLRPGARLQQPVSRSPRTPGYEYSWGVGIAVGDLRREEPLPGGPTASPPTRSSAASTARACTSTATSSTARPTRSWPISSGPTMPRTTPTWSKA